MSHILSMTSELRQEALKMQLRQADVQEVVAASGKSPEEALRDSIDLCDHAYVMIHKGKVEGAFGISEVDGWGIPWMLATDKLNQFSWRFLRQSREVVAIWLQHFPKLYNCVDSRHTDAIRWLKWLGFTIHESIPVRLHDSTVDFYQFTYHRSDLNV